MRFGHERAGKKRGEDEPEPEPAEPEEDEPADDADEPAEGRAGVAPAKVVEPGPPQNEVRAGERWPVTAPVQETRRIPG